MTDRHHLRACHTTQKLLYGYDWGAPKDTLDERLEGDGVTAKSLRTLAIGYHKYPRKTNQGRDGHDAGQINGAVASSLQSRRPRRCRSRRTRCCKTRKGPAVQRPLLHHDVDLTDKLNDGDIDICQRCV
jgi:hypothetical protein